MHGCMDACMHACARRPADVFRSTQPQISLTEAGRSVFRALLIVVAVYMDGVVEVLA